MVVESRALAKFLVFYRKIEEVGSISIPQTLNPETAIKLAGTPTHMVASKPSRHEERMPYANPKFNEHVTPVYKLQSSFHVPSPCPLGSAVLGAICLNPRLCAQLACVPPPEKLPMCTCPLAVKVARILRKPNQ